MPKMPHWPLDDVKSIAAQHGGLAIKKSRALDFFPSPAIAYAAARTVIAALTVDAFSETTVQQFDERFDVYGIQIDGAGWMLKFTIYEAQPQVVVISLHPLERPLRTNKGTVKP